MTEDPLRIELIKHLSAEIISSSQFLHTLRSRMAFNVLIGPFLVLGSALLAATKTNTTWPNGALQLHWWWLALAVLCYFLLGVYGYLLDQYLTGQCDFLRTALFSIAKNQPIGGVALDFSGKLKWNHKLAYLPGFAIVLVAFSALTVFFLPVLFH
jgi:hypothetical protein